MENFIFCALISADYSDLNPVEIKGKLGTLGISKLSILIMIK